MRRILIFVIGMTCSWGRADEMNAPGSELATPNATTTHSQPVHSAQAKAAREALTVLLNGVEALPAATDEKTAEQAKNLVRAEKLRSDEASVGVVPQGVMTSAVRHKFAALRDKMRSVSDVAYVADELASFVHAHPGHREARITQARLEILLDKPHRALQTLAPLIGSIAAKNHPDWQPWFWAGTAYLATGNIDRARDALDVAVAKEGGVVDVWVQLAVLEQELGNHVAALQYVAIAEQIAPQAAGVHLNRAYSLEHLGRFDEALQSYQRFMVSEMNVGAEVLRPSVMRRIAAISNALSNQEVAGRRPS